MIGVVSRRRFLALAALAAVGCEKAQGASRVECTDTTGLAAADAQARLALRYTDETPQRGKRCAGCQQFQAPPSEGKCGACKVIRGPISPDGFCNAFTPKA